MLEAAARADQLLEDGDWQGASEAGLTVASTH